MEKTINEVFLRRAEGYDDRTALERKVNGAWEPVSWRQYYENAREAGLGLGALGVARGDRVAVFSDNCLEWLYTDMGGLGMGAVIVPLYPTITGEEAGYIVDNSGAKVLVTGNADQLAKALEIMEDSESLETIVTIPANLKPADNPTVISFDELRALGRKRHEAEPEQFANTAAAIDREDLASIVYTSGTTGLPKGVMISHKNIVFVLDAFNKVSPPYATEQDQTVPFLPLSHVFGRIADHFLGMFVGVTASHAQGFATLLEDIQEKRPTIVLAVPRVCEKIYQKIMEQVESQPPLKQKIFFWSQKVGERVCLLREKGEPVPPLLALKFKLAYNLVFKKLADKLGGRVRYILAAGGPTAQDIQLFFNSAGILVLGGYGMTETTAPATISRLDDYRIGAVGPPLPGVEIAIAEDGEVLIRGDNVFAGYWGMEEATREAFTPDGYLKTGDLGAIDDKGFLSITGRKKELIITAGGKNIAPQKIESVFMTDPLFLHCVVVGDRRKYLTALVNINLEQAALIAGRKGLAFQAPEDLLDDPAFIEVVQGHVDERNGHLARFETIKKFRIVRTEFSQETGEMTASLKLKKNVIREKYGTMVEEMYME